jgi:hypothetical protein
LGRYKPSPDTLSGAHLENADLDNSHLEEIFLDGAHFEDAAVDGTHFDNAHEIKKAHFKGAEADIRTVWPAGSIQRRLAWRPSNETSARNGREYPRI